MSKGIGPSAIVLSMLLGLPALIVAFILIRRGWKPKREGIEPHCRPCGYLLVGLESDRCPECGTQLSPENIVLGSQRRRPGVATAGAIIGLMALLLLAKTGVGIVDEIDWYHYKPTFWLMHDLKSKTLAIESSALVELCRRDTDGNLSSKYEQQLIEMALVHQALTTTGPITTSLVDFANQKYRDGTMNDAQKLRFGRQCIQLGLLIRPTVLLGDEVPYQVTEAARVGSSTLWVNTRGRLVRIDGKTVREWTGDDGGSSSMSGLGSGGSSGGSVPCASPGKHLLEVTTHVQVFRSAFGRTDMEKPLFEQDVKVQGEFLVLAEAPPGYFTTDSDPAIAQKLTAAMKPVNFKIETSGHPYLNGMMQVTSSPEDIAFDVFTRVNGREYRLGSIACRQGRSCGYELSAGLDRFAMNPPPTQGDLILRSNEKTARGTIDQYSIWKGELIFPAVQFSIMTKR